MFAFGIIWFCADVRVGGKIAEISSFSTLRSPAVVPLLCSTFISASAPPDAHRTKLLILSRASIHRILSAAAIMRARNMDGRPDRCRAPNEMRKEKTQSLNNNNYWPINWNIEKASAYTLWYLCRAKLLFPPFFFFLAVFPSLFLFFYSINYEILS